MNTGLRKKKKDVLLRKETIGSSVVLSREREREREIEEIQTTLGSLLTYSWYIKFNINRKQIPRYDPFVPVT